MGFETLWVLFVFLLKHHLNFIPMGFETYCIHSCATVYYYLNFIPMGFETKCFQSIVLWAFIWTLSLWDLKPSHFSPHILVSWFELYPYGIWNLHHSCKSQKKVWWFELYPYGIWNTSSTAAVMMQHIFELYPYGIWNNIEK